MGITKCTVHVKTMTHLHLKAWPWVVSAEAHPFLRYIRFLDRRELLCMLVGSLDFWKHTSAHQQLVSSFHFLIVFPPLATQRRISASDGCKMQTAYWRNTEGNLAFLSIGSYER